MIFLFRPFFIAKPIHFQVFQVLMNQFFLFPFACPLQNLRNEIGNPFRDVLAFV